jgi:hypothetical protein
LTGEVSALLLVYAPEEWPLDYSRRLARLRWRRALAAVKAVSPEKGARSEDVLKGAAVVVVVRDVSAIPALVSESATFFSGRIVPAWPVASRELPGLETLRQIETAQWPRLPEKPREENPPAVGFDVRLLPPQPAESFSAFVERLFVKAREAVWDGGFRALRLEDPASRDLEELRRLLPPSAKRVCDVGALGNDPAEALEKLASGRETFDAFLFSGVLECVEDPVRALRLARRLAAPEAVLVASVANVGALALARELLEGRFDPLASGLFDARHIRWFDRRFFTEALEEAGWSVARRADRIATAAAEEDSFLTAMAAWPGLDASSLRTRSWVAVAYAGEGSAKF